VLERRADNINSGTGTPVCGIPFRLDQPLRDKCKANAVSFTSPLTPITKAGSVSNSNFFYNSDSRYIIQNTNTAGVLPDGTQCGKHNSIHLRLCCGLIIVLFCQDHALELQALQFAIEESGACDAIKGIITASGAKVEEQVPLRKALLSDMFNQINGASNAFSLDAGVNNVVSAIFVNFALTLTLSETETLGGGCRTTKR
jgi:hypothetical protein